MDIVIVSQYLRDVSSFSTNNSRFVYLANMLSINNNVEIITSNFRHSTKTKFDTVDKTSSFGVTMLDEPGYKKNVSIKRLYSHSCLAKNIYKYLLNRSKPDVIYCAIPSLSVASKVSKYCKENSVKFIIDIQDLWPEAFKMVLNFPLISDILFLPMTLQANKIYSHSDAVIAVSDTYVSRAMKSNKKNIPTYSAYLGTDSDYFNIDFDNKSKNSNITIAYCGSLSASYDLKLIMDAICNLNTNSNVKLLIMGDGSRKTEFMQYAKEKNIVCEFTGFLPYNEMVKRLLLCNVAVNPITKGSAASVINKVGDYAMAGLPVINTQECDEYRKLLEDYNAGINCNSAKEVQIALEKLINNDLYRKELSKGSLILGREKFDRKVTYKTICDIILK